MAPRILRSSPRPSVGLTWWAPDDAAGEGVRRGTHRVAEKTMVSGRYAYG